MGLGTVFMWYGNAKLMKFPFKIIFKFGYTPVFFCCGYENKSFFCASAVLIQAFMKFANTKFLNVFP